MNFSYDNTLVDYNKEEDLIVLGTFKESINLGYV